MSVELARELLAGFGMGIQDTGEAEADATPSGTARTAGALLRRRREAEPGRN